MEKLRNFLNYYSIFSTTASSAASAPGTTMSYRQLEESINKWTIELEEQEKIFLNQATQVIKTANKCLGTSFVHDLPFERKIHF